MGSRTRSPLQCYVFVVGGLLICLSCQGWPAAPRAAPSEWVDDEALVFLAAPYDSAAIDTVCAHYDCESRRRVSDAVWLIELQPGGDEVAVASAIDDAPPPGVSGACVNLVAVVPDLATSSQPPDCNLTIPEPLQFDCDLTDDAYEACQWPLARLLLNICPAWEVTRGSPSVVVVILDSGIDITHPDLATTGGRQISGVSFVADVAPPSDDQWYEDSNGHGTGMAGQIWALHDGEGIAGIAPEVELRVGKVMYDQGGLRVELLDYIEGLEAVAAWAASEPDRRFVVNSSVGYGYNYNTDPIENLARRCRELFVDSGLTNVLFVSAVGNEHHIVEIPPPPPPEPQEPTYRLIYGYADFPAAFSGAGAEDWELYSEEMDDISVAVGSVTARVNPMGYPCLPHEIKVGAYARTSWAALDTCEMVVDVAAPGGGVFCFDPPNTGCPDGLPVRTLGPSGDRYPWTSGTSLSTAQVSGVAALLWSATPALTAAEVKDAIRGFAKPWLSYPGSTAACHYDPQFAITHSHLFGQQSWEAACPSAVTPIVLPPVVTPLGTPLKANGIVDFDQFASVVLGSGVPDAGDMVGVYAAQNVYRVYGGELTEDATLENAWKVYFYGDLVIPSGVTLTVQAHSPEDEVFFIFAEGDRVEAPGEADPDRIEIRIESGGALALDAARVRMKPNRYGSDQDGCWYGIIVQDGGVLRPAASAGLDLALRGCTSGLIVHGQVADLEVLRVRAQETALEVGADLSIGHLSLEAGAVGCRVMGSAVLTFTGAAAAPDSIIGPGFGVGLVVDTGSGGEVAVSPFSLLSLGWDYGVHIKDSADVAVTGHLVVPSSYIAGIKIENSSGVTLVGQYVGGGMQHGVEVVNSSGVSMSDMVFVGNYSGITSGGTSAIECTSSFFVQNTNGCRVLAGATANLGDLSGPLGPGNNRFQENMGYDVANRNAGYWIFADGNVWIWQYHEYCPPVPGRTWGKVQTLCNP